jgi:hypothetical protein
MISPREKAPCSAKLEQMVDQTQLRALKPHSTMQHNVSIAILAS